MVTIAGKPKGALEEAPLVPHTLTNCCENKANNHCLLNPPPLRALCYYDLNIVLHRFLILLLVWDESVYNAECICWHSLIMKQVSCFPFVMFINPFFVALSSIELLTRFKPSVFILTQSNCVCQIDHISPRCLRKLDKKLFISYRGFFFILWSLEEVGFWRLLLEKSKLCERNMTRRRMMSSTSKSSSPYFKTCHGARKFKYPRSNQMKVCTQLSSH